MTLFLLLLVTMQAAQQIEVYWMALPRDIPFSQYSTDDVTQLAARTDLTRLR